MIESIAIDLVNLKFLKFGLNDAKNLSKNLISAAKCALEAHFAMHPVRISPISKSTPYLRFQISLHQGLHSLLGGNFLVE